MQKLITQIWYQGKAHWLCHILNIASKLYGFVLLCRQWLFCIGIKKTTKVKTPVIVVGNVTVGGTGKTPAVIAICEHLKAQGYRPGVVSRGYGAKVKEFPQWVKPDSDPWQMGDEPCLIAKATACPVIIHPKRSIAVETLIMHHDCDIIISDDGLQHYAMGRDIEIIMIDGDRGFGNAKLLPLGPLREPLERIDKADFLVVNGEGMPAEIKAEKAVFSMSLQGDTLYNLADPSQQRPLSDMQHLQVHAAAGIGNPDKFFTKLKENDIELITHVFPDHYPYQAHDFHFLGEGIIIMTEKDAVKCKSFADPRFWYLPVRAQLPDQFWEELMNRLTTMRNEACSD